MDKELNEELRENIDNLIESGTFENKKIFLFGMNISGERTIWLLKKKGYSISGILDNNIDNQGKLMLGVLVYSPDYLQSLKSKEVCVLIASKYYPDMRNQLVKMGFVVNKHIFRIMEQSKENMEQENYLEEIEEQFYSYLEIYNRLTRKFDDDTVYLLTAIANGDIYIAASLIKMLNKKWKSVVLFVVGKACEKIARMFTDNQVESITKEEWEALYNTVRVLGAKRTRIFVPPSVYYFDIFPAMYGYKQFNFMDFMANAAFDLGEKYEISVPKKVQLEAEDLRLNGKEIIISPYANTVSGFPVEFWEKLVYELKQRDYTVYTNSCGEAEPAVKGTETLFLPIDKMCDMIKDCGAFIAIRSGLCEVIATAMCKKIIMYPDKGMGFGTVKDYFSLNEMGLCDDANEIIFYEDKENDVIREILNIIDNNGEVEELL